MKDMNQVQSKDSGVQVIDRELCDQVSESARKSVRLRMNYNFHTDTADSLNRLLNAMEPGTYIRPHRHLNPDKEDVILVLRGAVSCFVFDSVGRVTQRVDLSPEEGRYGLEIAPGRWHSLVVTAPHTVLYELKRGPYQPIPSEDFAPWAPDGSDVEAVREYLDMLMREDY